MDTQLVDQIHIQWKQVFHALKKTSRSILEELSLTKVDANILQALLAKQQMTKVELATYLSFEPHSLTRSIDRLTQQGCLKRQEKANDRRYIILSLTPQGRKCAKHYMSRMRKFWQQSLGGVNTVDLQQLATTLSTMVTNLDYPGS